MGCKIDFHVHTYYSQDSSITLKQIVAFAKKSKLDGVAITDHDTIKGALNFKSSKILIIPGIEVSTLEGHLLGINIDSKIPAKLSMKESIEKIHDDGGIAIAPHPSTFYRSPPTKNVHSYDAVEVINASSIPFSILTSQSKRFAQKLNLPQVGGSDSHYAPEIGSAYTIISADPNIEQIIDAIESRATMPMGNSIPWKIRFERAALGLKNRIKK